MRILQGSDQRSCASTCVSGLNCINYHDSGYFIAQVLICRASQNAIQSSNLLDSHSTFAAWMSIECDHGFHLQMEGSVLHISHTPNALSLSEQHRERQSHRGSRCAERLVGISIGNSTSGCSIGSSNIEGVLYTDQNGLDVVSIVQDQNRRLDTIESLLLAHVLEHHQ